jgi:hypothetical protein
MNPKKPMPDKRPLNVPALLRDAAHLRLPGPELYILAADRTITLPDGERRLVRVHGRYLKVSYQGENWLHHRLVAKLALGLSDTEPVHVHHVNGKRHDNRPENLLPMTPRAHMQQERMKHPLFRVCDECGLPYLVGRTTVGAQKHFCSRVCRNRWLAREHGARARRIARSHERGHSRAEIERARRDPAARWPGWL